MRLLDKYYQPIGRTRAASNGTPRIFVAFEVPFNKEPLCFGFAGDLETTVGVAVALVKVVARDSVPHRVINLAGFEA